MSADNWTTCPNCVKLETSKIEKLRKQAEESYGSVSFTEYAKLLRQLENAIKSRENKEKEREDTFTLREDYEIGVYNGKFEVNFGASCNKCGWQHNFKHSEELK